MSSGGKSNRCVLFVDDSNLMRRAAERCLSGQYDVLLAADGTEALEVLDAHPEVGAVITDLSMPEMDGHELLKAIRESSDTKRQAMPVMIVTGSASDEILAAVRDAGADGVMTKPFKADALLKRVAELLDRPSALPESTLETTVASKAATPESAPQPPCIETSAARLQQRLRQAVALHTRHGLPLSVMQLQVENIDAVVSKYGRKAGNSVMRYVQKIIGKTLRDEDSCGPCAEDAYTLVLPMTDAKGAGALAGRLEQAFARRTVRIRKEPLELRIKLVRREVEFSAEDIELLSAGMDQSTRSAEVVEFRVPRGKAPVDPQASRASEDRANSAAVSV